MYQNIASVDFKEIGYKEKKKTDKSIINQFMSSNPSLSSDDY